MSYQYIGTRTGKSVIQNTLRLTEYKYYSVTWVDSRPYLKVPKCATLAFSKGWIQWDLVEIFDRSYSRWELRRW